MIHSRHGFQITTEGKRLVAVGFPNSPPPAGFDRTALSDLLAFLAGFTPDLSDCPPFHQRAYQAMQAIPPGSTMTYGQLAAEAGSPGAARAIGSACSRNQVPLIIPCHRVVASQGLGGFTGGLEWKKCLLRLEAPQHS